MDLNLDNARLRGLIPNAFREVEGETPLYDKLQPFLSSARSWLERYFLGPDFQPEGELYSLAEKIIVNMAFAQAVPSLDLVLTPAGFAVINTEGRAPASKERVERLVASLNSFVDANAAALLLELHKLPEWADSENGRWFKATFIPTLEHVRQFRRDGSDMMGTYLSMRELSMRFEKELGERFLGRTLMDSLRSSFPTFDAAGSSEIYAMISEAEVRYISYHRSDRKAGCPDMHEVWHLARPIMAELNYWPELREIWLDEMGETLRVEPFVNRTKGGFFF